MKNEIELLNSEGPILVASQVKMEEKCFLLTDKKTGETQYVYEENFRKFLNGEIPIIFPVKSDKHRFDQNIVAVHYEYDKYPDSMKPSNRDLHDFVDAFIISLTKEEWRWASLWTESFGTKGTDRLSDTWFIENQKWMHENVRDKLYDINMSHDTELEFFIPRMNAKIILFSVGRIAYSHDVKIPTAQIAYEIVTKLESQMDDLQWNKRRF